jgi:DNA-binding response OmpR family regulator
MTLETVVSQNSALSPARRALIIEADDDYAALMSTLLNRDGWESQRASDPGAGLKTLSAKAPEDFGVILVNTPAEPLNGSASALSAIRSASTAPLIAICDEESAGDRVDQAVQQEIESADYNLVKPFSPRRFRAAVRAVSRRGRFGAAKQLSAVLRVGNVTLNCERLEVMADNRRVELSPREFALLHLLLANHGSVLTRDELARLAWGRKDGADSRAVDNTIQRLRQKIETNPKVPRYLLTERGTGYRFASPDGS